MLTSNFLKSRHRIMPNLITVTFYSSTATGFAGGKTVSKVERRPASIEEREIAQAAAGSQTRTFHLWVDQLGGTEPKQGDKLSDSNGTWQVNFADLELADARWKLVCVKQIA